MEALASYMHESSGLPQDEFDFNAQVSQGGPIGPGAEVLNVENLDSKLANLSERLKQRETELSILDQVLLGVYTQEGATPRAHPSPKGGCRPPLASGRSNIGQKGVA